MRVTCPCCHERFDVAHMAILKEARRLTGKAEAGRITGDVDGNRRAPEPGENDPSFQSSVNSEPIT